jgi:hypothetical protein
MSEATKLQSFGGEKSEAKREPALIMFNYLPLLGCIFFRFSDGFRTTVFLSHLKNYQNNY